MSSIGLRASSYLATRAMQAWPGSIRGISLQNRTPYARYAYDSYGQTRSAAGIPLNVGYTGHLWDASIQQYFAPFRYYNPAAARWTMRDPLGYIGGQNMYIYVNIYVNANPLLFNDYLGLVSESQCQNIRMLKDEEEDFGTRVTSIGNSNTWSYKAYGNKNVSEGHAYSDFNDANVETPWGFVDVDYFMDISSLPFFLPYDVRYVMIRLGDTIGDLGKNWPYQDPKESNLLRLMNQEYDTFAELFPDWWLDKVCP